MRIPRNIFPLQIPTLSNSSMSKQYVTFLNLINDCACLKTYILLMSTLSSNCLSLFNTQAIVVSAASTAASASSSAAISAVVALRIALLNTKYWIDLHHLMYNVLYWQLYLPIQLGLHLFLLVFLFTAAIFFYEE